MFQKHPFIWASLVGILVLLNLWKWLPGFGAQKNRDGRNLDKTRLALDFPEVSGDKEGSILRDPFSVAASPSSARRRRTVAKRTGPPVLPTPLPTAMGLAADGSVLEAEGGYRLMGIVSRQGKSQALIGKGDRLFQVGLGESLEETYEVRNITQNEVFLVRKQTGATQKLRIWEQPEATP